jgi:Xaa-Pro aminopeptidase
MRSGVGQARIHPRAAIAVLCQLMGTSARVRRPRAGTVVRSASVKTASRLGAERAGGVGGADVRRAFSQRITRLQAAIRLEEASHLLVTNPVDVAYLTGFLGGDSYLLVSASQSGGGGVGGRPVLLSDSRFEEELAPQRADCDVLIRTQAMQPALIALLKDLKVPRLAIQGEQMTVAEFRALEERFSGSGSVLIASKGVVPKLRLIKDELEIALISKAIAIQQAALKSVLPTIRPGMTELAIAARLEAAMKERGSSTPAFESIVAANANGSMPHYCPANVKLRKGQPLLIDWGAVHEGYRGDMTRTFAVGKWPAQIAEIYDIVLEAHELSAAALGPGKSCKSVDAIAREHIKKHNYGEKFGHSLGHGLGLDTHELPRLSHLADQEVLEVGMVVTIEPGIYLPGVGGVRIEDDYVITKDGARNLCSLPKSRKWSTL